MIALSFVRSAADVMEAKQIIAAHKKDVPVIAKLEKPQALDQLEAILEGGRSHGGARRSWGGDAAGKSSRYPEACDPASDGWRKPVIIATQMLESMIENPRPTRAEASDVANAIFDGTDAVMLSAETASGRYPNEAVCMMAKDCGRSRKQYGRTTCSRAAAPPPRAFDFRDDLRIDRACRRRPKYRGHRGLYRNRQQRPYGIQVPARSQGFTPSVTYGSLQSHESCFGECSR